MGEVYKARDTRLDRTVAIKVLPAELSANPERRARFEREAKTIAGLTHPHICTLYDVGEHDGTTFLVMEHLPGQTLADRLLKGPLPLAQALDIATQIADALAAAHKHGIIHRDLKPGNVMLTGGGSGRSGVTSAKLLDFGLAKLVAHGERPALASGASAATQSLPMTVRGTIVGTLQYMAPEQLEGKEADARTDLWALGALLYEMVTGKRAFQADSDVSLIGAILNTEPAGLATLQPLTPPSLERLVKKCLAKHPDDRWDTAHDVADELRWIHGNGPAGAGAFVQPPSRHGFWLAGGALVLVAATAAIMWLALGRRTQPDRVVRSAVIGIQPADALLGGISAGSSPTLTRNRPSQTALAMTRDGRRLVFAAREGSRVQLYVRDVWGRAVTATAIPNTDGADAPVLSPDDQWVAFWVPAAKSADGWVLKRTPLDGGGTPVEICRAAVPMGASWGDDGHIVFSENEAAGLRRVSIDGGTPTVVTNLKPGEVSHRLPHVLPGSRAVLFTVLEQVYNWDTARVVAYRLGDKAWTEVVRGAADARYLPTGHLIFFRRGRLMAVGFNLEQLKKTGNEVGLEGDVLQNTNGINTPTDSGAAQVAVSSSGTLAYVAGGEVPDVNRRLVWVDRQGRVDALDVPPKPYYTPRLSPDGRRVAVATHQSERRIWVHDLSRPNSLVAVTPQEVGAMQPLWSRDGQRLAFGASPMGRPGLFWTRADGSQPQPEPLLTPEEGDSFRAVIPASWVRDEQLVYVAYSQATSHDIWLLSRDGSRLSAAPLFATRNREQWPQLSPDGLWLAYVSDASGKNQVFLARFPGLVPQTPVAGPVASSPVWARNGRELFYVQSPQPGVGELVAHDIGPGGAVAPKGRVLFRLDTARLQSHFPTPGFDVSPNGDRFLFAQHDVTTPPPPPNQIQVIENWFEELKAKVPAGGAK